MRGELVAIDLETTGLDATQDAMIEVGAVRLRDGKITDEFSTLINPGIPIPEFITQLTGIRTADVQDAPTVDKVLPQIIEFVGDSPIIAHNITLDANFLYRYGILKRNVRIDTFDLASVVLPRAARYTLSALTTEFGIEMGHAHRALDDAKASALLYNFLWEKTLKLPLTTLREICDAARDFDDWDSKAVFVAAMREHPAVQDESVTTIFSTPPYFGDPLKPHEVSTPLPVEEVTKLLTDQSSLASSLPNYEKREPQVEMARAVSEAFNDSQHVMIEAGTGVGKSLAYLIPSALWATNNDERVVISTNTLNLQDQLIQKDIPILKQALDVPFQATVMKGRGNYLCPRRLAALRRRRPTSVDELRTLAKILVWSLESNTGDKGEISIRGPIEHSTWQRLSAEDEDCTIHHCETLMGGVCPFYKARKAADSAHLLIVNHALLISDAMTENRVLPDYRYLVIDEGHQLEDAVTNGQSKRLDEAMLIRRLADLGTPNRGVLGDLVNSVRGHVSEKELQRVEMFAQGIEEATTLMRVHIENFFKALNDFILNVGDNRSQEISSPVRLIESMRNKSEFGRVQAVAKTLDEFFAVISDAMARLATALGRMKQYTIPGYDDLVNSTGSAARHLEDMRQQLKEFVISPDAKTIYWVFGGQGNELVIQSAPLHVGSLIEQYLWQRMESIVVTSATLRTNDSFDFMQDRLNAQNIKPLELGSPFNYKESTLVYIPDNIPEPTDKNNYQHAVENGIIQLAAALNGRVMVLFTSYAQLRQTAQAITPRLALGNIAVYGQNEGSSRQALLEGFRAAERAVLLGTRSFWEGVDIAGDSLSALIIARLPFAVPSDPIFAARSETYPDSFNQYAIPDAILRFRQGFGRLIRSSSDRGVVTVFDSRILTKRYGAQFIESLPNCTIQYGSIDKLGEAAKNWLKRGTSQE
jgi:ATP-dependent DNA helicase DinG